MDYSPKYITYKKSTPILLEDEKCSLFIYVIYLFYLFTCLRAHDGGEF